MLCCIVLFNLHLIASLFWNICYTWNCTFCPVSNIVFQSYFLLGVFGDSLDCKVHSCGKCIVRVEAKIENFNGKCLGCARSLKVIWYFIFVVSRSTLPYPGSQEQYEVTGLPFWTSLPEALWSQQWVETSRSLAVVGCDDFSYLIGHVSIV